MSGAKSLASPATTTPVDLSDKTRTSSVGLSTVGAAWSPAVPIAAVYSGTSCTADSTAFTLPVNSGTSFTATSSPAVPTTPVYSGASLIADSPPFTPPVNSGTSMTGATWSPLLDIGVSGFGSGVGVDVSSFN